MDYGERFNYGKIKDDFGYPDYNGYYSSTHTSFDSKFNQISSLDNLQEQYPDKFKTFHDLKTYRWGKGDNFFATYGTNKFGELELLDTNWYDSMPMGNKELKEENERLKKYIDYLKEKNDALKKTNKKITKESKENEKKQKLLINFVNYSTVKSFVIEIIKMFIGTVKVAPLKSVSG